MDIPHRLILVADEEESVYRAIRRIGNNLNANVYHCVSKAAMDQWLAEHQCQFTDAKVSFCLIYDSKLFKSIPEFEGELPYPRICCSRSPDATAIDSIKSGIFAFVEKPFMLEMMKNLIEQAFSKHAANLNLRNQFRALTKREVETCDLVVQGCSNKEISEKLAISIKTVKVHRANLMRKTQTKSVADLLRLHDRFNLLTQGHSSGSNGSSVLEACAYDQDGINATTFDCRSS